MPVRLLKPKLRTSRKWNACSYMAQTAYVRMIMVVDDAGRYFGHPKLVASEIFPLGGPRGEDVGAAEMDTLLAELASAKLVELYQHEGETFIQLTAWEERIRTVSRFPDPPNCLAQPANDIKCQQMIASPPTPTPTPTPTPKLPKVLDTERFKGAWEQWVSYRKARRLPLTFQTIEMQIKKLSGFGEDRAIQCIEQSITNGWQGLFEVRVNHSEAGGLSGVDKMMFSKEYERILSRIGSLRQQYTGLQSWRDDDRAEMKTLKARCDELKPILGITI